MEIIRKLTSSSSPWFEKTKTDKIWLCESVGRLKGIGKQGKIKMNDINVHNIANELRIHTIADLQLHVCHRGKVFLALTLALALDLALDMALYLSLDLVLALEMGREVKVIILHDRNSAVSLI